SKPPHRPGEAERQAEDGDREEPPAQRPAPDVDVGRDRRQERRRDEGRERALAAPAGPHEEGDEQGDDRPSEACHRIAPGDHGSFLRTVSPSPISASTRSSAGHTSHPYISRMSTNSGASNGVFSLRSISA